MRASNAGHMECVQVLLDKGADVNIHDKVRCHYILQHVLRVPRSE